MIGCGMMETVRIINFMLQSGFLMILAGVIIHLIKNQNPSPVYRWFIYLSVSLCCWVSGRFTETVLYLFFPGNNSAYVFAANYQYIGLLGAGTVYLIWNLYQAKPGAWLEKAWVKPAICSGTVVTVIIVFTNESHHLFYTKLVMGEQVGHGILFVPLMILGYSTMFLGYLLALSNIFRQKDHIPVKIILHTMTAVVPALAAVVRSWSKTDLFDYTPVVLGFSLYSLYLLLFRYRYINIVASSIDSIVEQTHHPIAVYNNRLMQYIYKNKAAQVGYTQQLEQLKPHIGTSSRLDGTYQDKELRIDVSTLDQTERLLTITDVTHLSKEMEHISEQVSRLSYLNKKLEAQNANIDAYIDTLGTTEKFLEKQRFIHQVRETTDKVYQRIHKNLSKAESGGSSADALLLENIRLAEACISEIRKAVQSLKEDAE